MMMRLAGLLGSFCAFIVAFSSIPDANAAIPGTAVTATEYKVTVHKVELCPNTACGSGFTLGTGQKIFDIASVSAGAQAGAYASARGISAGETYTYIRVTIGTTFTLSGGGTDNGGQNCQTVNGNAAGGHTSVGTGTVGGAGTSMSLTIPNVTYSTITQADYDGFNLTKVDGASTATILFPLTSAYTSDGTEPLISIAFDTSGALGVVQTGAGTCSVFLLPPTVTISVQ